MQSKLHDNHIENVTEKVKETRGARQTPPKQKISHAVLPQRSPGMAQGQPEFRTPFLTCQRCNALNIIEGDEWDRLPSCCVCGYSLHLVVGVHEVDKFVCIEAQERGVSQELQTLCATLIQSQMRVCLAKRRVIRMRYVGSVRVLPSATTVTGVAYLYPQAASSRAANTEAPRCNSYPVTGSGILQSPHVGSSLRPSKNPGLAVPARIDLLIRGRPPSRFARRAVGHD
jgi:hypothetical protein